MMLYKYGMKARGFSIGCQPGGVKYYEDADKLETGYWNYIYYDRELTDEEIKKNAELKILINLVKHEIEWADNDNFYTLYKKQLENIKSKLESEVK